MSDMNRFKTIYDKKRWGIGSGDGSTATYCAAYIAFIEKFISENEVKTVLDIGCGDLQVFHAIRWQQADYIGIDVAVDNSHLSDTGCKFFVGDFTNRENIPSEIVNRKHDLVLVKDVLQHLSDEEVTRFVENIQELDYKYLILVNDYRYSRSPHKNGTPRDVKNPYS